jgi:hypothetical protein
VPGKDTGLFFCAAVSDVMKHCVETGCLDGAQSKKGLKNHKTWE